MAEVVAVGGEKIWVKGVWKGESEKCAAIIGSRRMTDYGQRVIEKMVPRLVEEGWTIVSGFMYGVDQTAHRMALTCGGRTIAVLGWGIDCPMESSDKKLAEEIIKSGGAIISQWKTQVPTLWTFPLRNRIVAAISQKIFVIEAARRSGALITVDWGIKLKKQIWAVPGPITSKVSEGTNRLIAEGAAKMWLPNQSMGARESESGSRSIKRTDIYSLIENEAMTVDELARKTGRLAEEVGAEITMMMLRGEVEERGGKYYIGS